MVVVWFCDAQSYIIDVRKANDWLDLFNYRGGASAHGTMSLGAAGFVGGFSWFGIEGAGGVDATI